MYNYKAKVKRIVDGDTLVMDVDLGFNVWLRDEKFRLAGINAAETRGEERERGFLAKKRLGEMAPVDSEQIINVRKSKEKYGRYLCVIKYGEGSINQQLINENLAVPFYANMELSDKEKMMFGE